MSKKPEVATSLGVMATIEQSKWVIGAAALLVPVLSKAERLKISGLQRSALELEYVDLVFIFTLAFTTTRDLAISLGLTFGYFIVFHHLFHEDSGYTVIPEDYHPDKSNGDSSKVTNKQIGEALDILERAHKEYSLSDKPEFPFSPWDSK
jgi:hypothetical protein